MYRTHLSCRYPRQGWSALAISLFAIPGCTVLSPATTEVPDVVLHYQSSDPGVFQSTLSFARAGDSMSAVTHTADGSRLTEEVRLDGAGRLLDGKTSLRAADSSKSREVVFDVAGGIVEVTTPLFHRYWQVPQDLPWAWTSLLHDPERGPVATPLAAMVVQRAAATSEAVRWLDIGAYSSHSVMVDQFLIPDEGFATVLVGDDWAELTGGVPTQMHLSSLETSLQSEEKACDC